MRKFLSVFLVIILLSGCAKLKSSIEDVYKLAVIAPLTGPYSLLGASIVNGTELAVKEANENGGINGQKVVLIKEDDGGLVGEGAFFAYRLTRTEKVLGVIGHLNSDISIPASEFYMRAMIPQISPGSTSPYFTDREATRGYVFRTIGRDDTQGRLAAQYVIDNGFKRVGILYNDRAYGTTLAGEFAKALKVLPIKEGSERPSIVYYNMIEVGKKDYGSLLAQIAPSDPDVIFLAGEHDDAGHLVKDFPKYGLEKAQFIGGDGIDHQEFLKIGGINTNGAITVSSPKIVKKEFIENYRKHFKENPTGYAANSYDAASILIDAMRKVKIKDSELVSKEVALTMDFPGITGSISFDEKGDLTTPGFALSKVVDGMFTIITEKGVTNAH